MQLDPTIHRSIAKIPPFQVDQDGKLVPEKNIKHVKMIRPLFSADLPFFSWPFLDFKIYWNQVWVSCSWIQPIHRSIAKIPPFQVDPDGKLVSEKNIKHVKMIRPLFSADLPFFSWPFLDFKSKGYWVCVSCHWIQRSIDPSRKFCHSKRIQMANWSLKKIWKMSKW